MRPWIVRIIVLGLFASGASVEGSTFADKPVVTKAGEQTTVVFTAAAATDVEVAVLDKAGKVVRHLAAGVLGDNAPAPLQKGSLKQSLTWDGKDDRGQVAQGGPFQIRVGLGLKPKLQDFLADNPAALTSVRGLAVAPNGDLFVIHVFGNLHPNDGTPTCSVFDRTGKYLRTILPFPAGLADERLKGMKILTRDDGEKVPFLYQAETRSVLPGAGDLPALRPVVTRDGRLAFVGIREGPFRYAQPGVNQIMTIRTDGGIPAEGLFGPELAKLSSNAACLALSPDEKTLYAAALRDGTFNGKALHAVYSAAWTDKEPKIFVGSKTEAGAGKDRLNTPRSVAVDGKGNVYIADRDNDRIAVFSPNASYLGELAVDKPERVEVHPTTGALYVLGGERIDRLSKFANCNTPKAVAELKLPSFKHIHYTVVLALDATANPPVLWAGSPQGSYAGFSLLRIEDKGDSFAAPVDIGRKNAQAAPSAGPVLNLELDRERGRLLVNSQTYDIGSGKWSNGLKDASGVSINGGVGSIGLDGNFYSQVYPNVVRRYGPDGKLVPFKGPDATAKGELVSPFKEGTMRIRGRGVTADLQGNVFVLWEDRVGVKSAQPNQLSAHAADGSLKKERLIDSTIRGVDSVRLDAAGNIYLALALRPGKDLLPSGLKGKVPDGPKDPDTIGNLNAYPLIYGSIAKFGPEGGVISPDCGGVACNFAFGAPIEVKGAKWIYAGASPVVSWRTPGTPDICACESTRFDVDGFGRSFFPDAAQCRVGILDTNGNPIGWFGGYGNVDAKGKDNTKADVPLWWPFCIAAGDGFVYVGDRLNRRVARVQLAYTTEVTQAIP